MFKCIMLKSHKSVFVIVLYHKTEYSNGLNKKLIMPIVLRSAVSSYWKFMKLIVSRITCHAANTFSICCFFLACAPSVGVLRFILLKLHDTEKCKGTYRYCISIATMMS